MLLGQIYILKIIKIFFIIFRQNRIDKNIIDKTTTTKTTMTKT
jgi:hypothetical protein